jgi:hypothetical protein
MQNKRWFLVLALALSLTAPPGVGARPIAKASRASSSAPAVNGTAANTAYLSRLRGKLLNNWNVPNGKNRVILSTVLNADGSFGDISLSSTPKNADAEIAGSEAFAKSQPLEVLPKGGQAKLILTFESSADPHGDSNSNVYTQIVPVPAVKAATPAAETQPAK